MYIVPIFIHNNYIYIYKLIPREKMLIELTSEQSISNYKDGPQQRMCAFILNYSCLPIGEKT